MKSRPNGPRVGKVLLPEQGRRKNVDGVRYFIRADGCVTCAPNPKSANPHERQMWWPHHPFAKWIRNQRKKRTGTRKGVVRKDGRQKPVRRAKALTGSKGRAAGREARPALKDTPSPYEIRKRT